MAKQSYSIKGTNISNGDAVGNQIEQTVSVDDNILPAPQELAEYKNIDPNPLAELSQCILDSSNGSIINVI